MNFYNPNLELLINTYLDTKTPIEDYKEIVNKILNQDFEDFVRKEREL